MTRKLVRSIQNVRIAARAYKRYPEMGITETALQKSFIDFATEAQRTCSGITEENARAGAKLVLGGRGGRLILSAIFSEHDDNEGDKK
jgi:hypothetical protein